MEVEHVQFPFDLISLDSAETDLFIHGEHRLNILLGVLKSKDPPSYDYLTQVIGEEKKETEFKKELEESGDVPNMIGFPKSFSGSSSHLVEFENKLTIAPIYRVELSDKPLSSIEKNLSRFGRINPESEHFFVSDHNFRVVPGYGLASLVGTYWDVNRFREKRKVQPKNAIITFYRSDTDFNPFSPRTGGLGLLGKTDSIPFNLPEYIERVIILELDETNF